MRTSERGRAEEMAKTTRVTRTKMRESRDVWLEVFLLALEKGLEGEIRTRPEDEIVAEAGDVANAALDAIEKRWPE